MKILNLTKNTLFILILSFFGQASYAQEDSNVIDAYEDYIEPAREVVFMHLNKSTYIKGEDIGFTAYVLDKKDKKPSKLTTNLYVTLEDKNKNVLAKKLILVNNGVASNLIEIDSTYKSGYYNIKAYTNWMLNFNEQNHYIESIRIIDPESETVVEQELVENNLDAQFLPESGHLLKGVINTIGVVVKDNLGYGLPFVEGTVLNEENEILTSFKTNKLGIGKFALLPKTDVNYQIELKHNNNQFNFDLNQDIESKGIVMSLTRHKSKIFITLKTNPETLDLIKNKRHTLLIHNGDNFDIMDIYFTDETTITKAIEYENTSTGINILTLFNENDQPIAERLFFNYNGLKILNNSKVSAQKRGDSISLKLNYKNLNPDMYSNISISVLPQDSESYNKHHNIISYVFLQPYINGIVEDADYYFTAINSKKQFELDNLLLTQGWSSYNWNDIFNNQANQDFTFEQGIRFKANINAKNRDLKNSYLLHAIGNNEPQIFDVSQNENSFIVDNVFPIDTKQLYLSKVKDNNELEPAQLYVQSFPNVVPKLRIRSHVLNPKFDYKIGSSVNNKIQFEKLKETQLLDEVTISASLDNRSTRIQKLGRHTFGKIKIINDTDRISYNTLTDYLRFYGLPVNEANGGFEVGSAYSYGLNNNSSANIGSVAGRPQTVNGGISADPSGNDGSGFSPAQGMLIYLDDVQLLDASFLHQYPLSNIDYIEINRRGFGGGARGAGGILKIYSNFGSAVPDNTKTTQKVELPLIFSAPKKFYIPKYRYYRDTFYRQYGVVDWKPNLKIDENGMVSFKIAKPLVPITLFIEGIANDGSFVFEEKSISLN